MGKYYKSLSNPLTHLLISFINGLGAIFYLFIIPGDPKNAWLLGLSKARFLMLLVLVIYTLSTFLGLRQLKANPSFRKKSLNFILRITKNKNTQQVLFSILLAGQVTALFLLIELFFPLDHEITAYLQRLAPILFLVTIGFIQVLLLLLSNSPNPALSKKIILGVSIACTAPILYRFIPHRFQFHYLQTFPYWLISISVYASTIIWYSFQAKKEDRQYLFLIPLFIVLGYQYFINANYHAISENADMTTSDQKAYVFETILTLNSDFKYLGNRNQVPLYNFLQALFINPNQSADSVFMQGKLVNIWLSLLLIAMVFVGMRSQFSARHNFIFVSIVAFSLFIFKSPYFQAEILYYFLSFWGFLFMCRMMINPSIKTAILAGLALGLAQLTKASALPGVLAVIAIFLLKELILKIPVNRFHGLRVIHPVKTWKNLGLLALMSLVFLGILFPYISENKGKYGHYFFNVNSHIYIWYDNWDEAKQAERRYNFLDNYTSIPAEELPGLEKYLHEHSLDTIAMRVSKGMKSQINNLTNLYGFFNYFAVYAIFLIIIFLLNLKEYLEVVKKNCFLFVFISVYFIGHIILFSWYSPIANGFDQRFTYGLFMPLLFSLLLPFEKVSQSSKIYKFGVFQINSDYLITFMNLVIITMLFIDISFIMPHQMTHGWFGK